VSDILKEPLEFALALKGVGKNDLFETRQALEVRLAGLAAQRRTDDDLHQMREALAKMKESMGQADEWCIHELRFHECIVEAARNAVMATFMEMLSRLLIESRHRTIQMLRDYSKSYQAHDKVFVAIESQDSEAASQAMMDHFTFMEERALESAAPPA
jgi:GntR family transcriptional repressor for pyruvate dehydrogenase complex